MSERKLSVVLMVAAICTIGILLGLTFIYG